MLSLGLSVQSLVSVEGGQRWRLMASAHRLAEARLRLIANNERTGPWNLSVGVLLHETMLWSTSHLWQVISCEQFG